MKFTVTFSSSNESEDLSFGLVFIPCPVWVQGENEIINLNPDNPHYQAGSVRKLMEKIPALMRLQNKHCVVLVHAIGDGSQADLKFLMADLIAEGFAVQVIQQN